MVIHLELKKDFVPFFPSLSVEEVALGCTDRTGKPFTAPQAELVHPMELGEPLGLRTLGAGAVFKLE